MNPTKVQWCDATWNPVRGCSRVSAGCQNCYAERIAARFSDFTRDRGEGDEQVAPFNGFARQTVSGPRWTGRVALIRDKLDEPLRMRAGTKDGPRSAVRPKRILVAGMSDLFHEALLNKDISDVLDVMDKARKHNFLVLTKRPERMKKIFSAAYGTRGPLPNLWLGVSVEDQATANERIPLLLEMPAEVRWVSYEPALGSVDFGRWLHAPFTEGFCDVGGRLDWIVAGGESGPGARPCDLAWIRSSVEQCKAAGVPAFVKQLGSNPRSDTEGFLLSYTRDRSGSDPSEWPEDLRVREFPKSNRTEET